MADGRRWMVSDRYGNQIYLTEERWQHIIEPENHPEMFRHEAELQMTIQAGQRKQDPLNPRKYRYMQAFHNLPLDSTHVVAIVLFAIVETAEGQLQPNNYITTAFMKEIG